jgi:hypothetical protein
LQNAVSNFSLSDTLGGVGDLVGEIGSGIGNAFSGFSIPGFQFGGQVSAGVPIRVGEGGSETFVPQTNGTILNAQDTEAMRGGGAPITIQFVFQRSISDNEARESASKLKRELQAQGINVEGTF